MRQLIDKLRPALMALDAETAHDLTIRALKSGLMPATRKPDAPCLATSLFGTPLANPVGVAAGFDKNAQVPDAMLRAGFGFTEVGTVTPRPQAGNPRPRVFRLHDAGAVINRYGFNNDGHVSVVARLQRRADKLGAEMAWRGLGINVGANKDTDDRVADYTAGVTRFAGLAHYLTINVSSPNTPGLRDLQAPQELAKLLQRVRQARDHAADVNGRRTDIVVKLAPDIAQVDVPAVVDCLMDQAVDGIAISNTTISRATLQSNHRHARETGGLSGKPLFEASTIMLARVYQLTHGTVPLIGIGGIDNGARAVDKIKAGATVLQLYTGLVFSGLGLLDDIKARLSAACQTAGHDNYAAMIGSEADDWAARESKVFNQSLA